MENELTLRLSEENRLAALKTSPEQYCKELRPRTIDDVFLSHEPAIATIAKTQGETVARAAVVYLLADALEFFNATEAMNDTQVAMTVDLIMEEYPYFKTDDLKLCFKNAMKMKYGKLYNRIDGQIIMNWLKEYNKERCTEADKQSYNEHRTCLYRESQPTEGLFYTEYRRELENRADAGDNQAKEAIRLSNNITAMLESRKLEARKKELEAFYQKQTK